MASDPRPALVLAGRLEAIPLADLLQVLAAGGQDGVLTVQDDESAAIGEIELRGGRVVRAAVSVAGERIGSILVRSRAAEPERVGEALRRQSAAAPRRPLGELLVEMGALEPRLLARSLSEQIAQHTAVIMGWRGGVFRFRLVPAGEPQACGRPWAVAIEPHELVLEAARLADEAAALPA